MGWVCKVCMQEAKYITDFGTSQIRNGKYRISRNGYCEEHKPIILPIKEYERQMANTNINENKKEHYNIGLRSPISKEVKKQ